VRWNLSALPDCEWIRCQMESRPQLSVKQPANFRLNSVFRLSLWEPHTQGLTLPRNTQYNLTGGTFFIDIFVDKSVATDLPSLPVLPMSPPQGGCRRAIESTGPYAVASLTFYGLD
jgi:hypothetical protein